MVREKCECGDKVGNGKKKKELSDGVRKKRMQKKMKRKKKTW